MAFLKHPNIVEIYDYDVSSWGFPYIVMEYLEGWSLKTEIHKYQQGLPLNVFKNFIKQIVSGLSFAHKKGVVHRDLKPENIFINTIDNQKIVKILDFGIAKVLFSTDDTQVVTKTNTIVGTPQYLSPEQIMGKEITPKSDQYALALIALEMLTGKPVREGKTFGEIVSSISTKNVEVEKMDLKSIKIEIAEALKKATNKNPENRFEDVQEFEKYLILEVDELEEKPTTSITFKKPKKKSFKYLYIFLFVFFLFGLFYFYTKVRSFKKEEVFSLLEKYNVPADLGEYLTSKENYLCFKGLNNLYLYTNNFNDEPVKVGLKGDEELLFGTEGGKVIIKKNGKIYLKNYFLGEKIEEREELLIDSFIEKKEIRISQDLNYLAVFDKKKLLVYEIINKSLKEIYSIDLKSGKLKNVKIGRQWLVYVLDNLLKVYDLREKKEIFEYSIDTSNFYSMDFFEEEQLLAIGGWFDLVFLFDFNDNNKKYTLNLPGITHSLKFIHNFPSLLISKGESVIIWRFREDKILKFQRSGKDFVSSFLNPVGIISRERRENKIYLFSYKDFFFSEELSPSKTEIWGLDYSDKKKLLFAGSSSGSLYSINIKKNKLKEYKLHTQGSTSVLALNDILITASDNKTITVWQFPEMKVFFRTEAHNWLINYLYLNENTKNLWSSSSDGYVKVLSFPGLKVLESIKTGDFSNAAIWVDQKEEILAVGTWNNQFLFFEKNTLKWELKRNYKIKSQAIYSISYLSSLNALVLCGIEPFYLYI